MDGIDLVAPEFGGVFLKIQHDGKIFSLCNDGDLAVHIDGTVRSC
jgi:hypothetical protein